MPDELAEGVGAEAVEDVLTILASSMLAVTTFSLSIANNAFTSAAETATPRVTALLQEDRTTQNVLASFLGAFVFSLLGVVGLNAGYYSASGRFILFVATGVVILIVLAALIRWISHLTEFGKMKDILDRVERRTAQAINLRNASPQLGGKLYEGDPPEDAVSITAEHVGYVQHIDMAQLADALSMVEGEAWVVALPGHFVHHASPLVSVRALTMDDDDQARLRGAFVCGNDRDIAQDPEFGLVMLAEIASRALSTALNDAGTAIDVLGRQARLLALWHPSTNDAPEYPTIHLPGVKPEEIIEAAFYSVARDGAATCEVCLRLQQALASIGGAGGLKAAALDFARRAIDMSEMAGLPEPERARLSAVAVNSHGE